MKLQQSAIPEVVIIEPTVFADERGWFMESFNEQRFHHELQLLGLAQPPSFVQDNHSVSHRGVLRGLHYQKPPYMQGKLVRVTQGAAYDVAVDIREGSPTFGQWVGCELSEKNKKMIWIPAGFAHAFLALEENTHFLYKTTDFYNNESEASIRWNDPALAIDWPLEGEPLLNEKDRLAPLLAEITRLPYSGLSKKVEQVDLRVMGDARGNLIPVEKGFNIPFDLKRVYYIFDTKTGVSRGFHAHRESQRLAVCVSGSCRMVLDDGKTRQELWLNSAAKGLMIGNMIWVELHEFSTDCVFIVFASDYYRESDYIRDYQQFLKEAKDE